MSEMIETSDQINININNSDSNSGGGGSFLDRIFDIGLKLLIPLILVFALFSVIIFFSVVLPLLDTLSSVGTAISFALPAPLNLLGAGLGTVLAWATGRS